MTISTNVHHITRAEICELETCADDALRIFDKHGNAVNLFVPPHVAQTLADTHARISQIKQDGHRLTYQGRHTWMVWYEPYIGWLAQSDEVTGDGDPHWYQQQAQTPLDLLDAIDAAEEENGCNWCAATPGEGALIEVEREGAFICDDCHRKAGEHEEAMQQMADDDAAHAAMDRAAGL